MKTGRIEMREEQPMVPLQPYDPALDFEEQVTGVWKAAVECLLRFPEREQNFWLQQFPVGSCELTSWIIGRLLLQLGFGDWTLYFGMVDTDAYPERGWGGHQWLELRRANGDFYSLDPTPHQFRDGPEPFLIRGESPLKAIYRTSLRVHPSSEVQTWYSQDLFALPLVFVFSELLGDRPEALQLPIV